MTLTLISRLRLANGLSRLTWNPGFSIVTVNGRCPKKPLPGVFVDAARCDRDGAELGALVQGVGDRVALGVAPATKPQIRPLGRTIACTGAAVGTWLKAPVHQL